MNSSREPLTDEHPMWEGAIVGLLGGVETGIVPPEQVIALTGQVCVELLQSGYLSDLGTLQRYLRERNAVIQLVARPFKAKTAATPGTRCLDVVTREPKGHWLMVCVGGGPERTEVRDRLRELAMSDEVNEQALTHDTGMLVV